MQANELKCNCNLDRFTEKHSLHIHSWTQANCRDAELLSRSSCSNAKYLGLLLHGALHPCNNFQSGVRLLDATFHMRCARVDQHDLFDIKAEASSQPACMSRRSPLSPLKSVRCIGRSVGDNSWRSGKLGLLDSHPASCSSENLAS